MRVVLELLRIIIILLLFGAVAWFILGKIYTANQVGESYQWIGAIGVYLSLYVLYRNKLQFTGWYKGKGRQKLPKQITIAFIGSSAIMLVLPVIIASFIN